MGPTFGGLHSVLPPVEDFTSLILEAVRNFSRNRFEGALGLDCDELMLFLSHHLSADDHNVTVGLAHVSGNVYLGPALEDVKLSGEEASHGGNWNRTWWYSHLLSKLSSEICRLKNIISPGRYYLQISSPMERLVWKQSLLWHLQHRYLGWRMWQV